MLKTAVICLTCLYTLPAAAENAIYGRVELIGLSRDNGWPLNRPGPTNEMVCNVNGPDGFLSIRSAPDSSAAPVRMLKRLAVIEIDTRQRHGHWVRVTNAYRYHDPDGRPIEYQPLPVTGWAHDGYLCGFLD